MVSDTTLAFSPLRIGEESGSSALFRGRGPHLIHPGARARGLRQGHSRDWNREQSAKLHTLRGCVNWLQKLRVFMDKSFQAALLPSYWLSLPKARAYAAILLNITVPPLFRH